MKTVETKKKISLGRNKDIQTKKEKREYIGRFAPYGYVIKNNQLIEDKECSHVVYTIFDLYDKGFSNTKIADYLNDRGIISPSDYKKNKKYIGINDNDKSKLWSRGVIRKIILNKVYNGSYLYCDEKTHKEIINDSLFERVNNRKIDKQNYSGNDFYFHNANEFNSKVYCKECGRVFTIESSKCKNGKERYLRCSSYDTRKHNKVSCSNKLAIRYDDLKNITQLFLEKEIFSKIDLKELINIYSSRLKEEDISNHRKYLKQERELLKKKIEKLDLNKYNKNNLIETLNFNNNMKLHELYTNRLIEIENQLKEIYSFARTKEIKKSEFHMDKFIIDAFIDKITIGKVIGNDRNILIELK